MRKALKFYLPLVNTDLFVSHMVESLCDFREGQSKGFLVSGNRQTLKKKGIFVGFLSSFKKETYKQARE